jgi:hypothetical protein
MIAWAHVLLAQATSVPPSVYDSASGAAYALGGGTLSIILFKLSGPLVEVLVAQFKRWTGDPEIKQKDESRDAIKDTNAKVSSLVDVIKQMLDQLRVLADQQRVTSEIQSKTLKEIEELRKENSGAHGRIEGRLDGRAFLRENGHG